MARVLLKFPIAILAILLVNGALQTLARCRFTSDYNDFDGHGDSYGGDLTCLYPWSKDGNISKDCCRKLVEMGRECDDSLIWMLTNTRGYTDKSDTIRERSYNAFERCEKAMNKDHGW
ncbi:hypothetical protein RJ639_044474 [Escallonia herrerae]|uniref:Prolamin-like domain-containing protein n=1 Tax=Escallonia herrerae TaxID=1293975 RepID=A0AA88WJL5_9ASTE|nr:hypothetical protein RJ639_044474 [Escallonia herrerae]